MNKNALAEARLQLKTIEEQIEATLPKHISVDHFVRVVMIAIQTDPKLLDVDRRSLWIACMKAAQDGLLPDGRHGAIVAYGNKAQWLTMIAGIRQKVRNSGEVATWEVHTVHKKDQFEYELGDHPQIIHRPAHSTDRGEIIAAYSVAVLKSGDISREVMWLDEIKAIQMKSKAGKGGPWDTHFGEMAKKTVARRHSKVLPMSTDMDDLLRRDDDEPGTGVGPAIQPAIKPGPKKSQADVLTMMAAGPEQVAPIDELDGQTDVLEAIEGKVEARHG